MVGGNSDEVPESFIPRRPALDDTSLLRLWHHGEQRTVEGVAIHPVADVLTRVCFRYSTGEADLAELGAR